jgi:hypothetical protein
MSPNSRFTVSHLLGRHGGFFHGPKANRLCISEASFWAFLEDYAATLLKQEEARWSEALFGLDDAAEETAA